jgi:hypothetical protein
MFDRYSAAVAPSWGRRALAIASVALHVSAGAVLVLYSICYIEEVAPPAVSLHFFSVAPPPPPPAASSAHRRAAKRNPKPTAPTPTTASKLVAPAPRDERPTGDNHDLTGDSTATSDGKPDGKADGNQPNGTGEQPARTRAAFTLAADRLRADPPHLPEWFTAQHPKQSVRGTFRICLDTSGHVSDVTPMTSIAGSVDPIIMRQIKDTWLYRAQALPVCFAQPFSFQID